MTEPPAVVTLPMYDFPELRTATSRLLEKITSNLSDVGWPVRSLFGDFSDHASLVSHWLDPNTALSQSCGLPYLEELRDHAQVLGTFLWRGVSERTGRYRSVLIVRHDDPRTVDDLAGAQPVINNPESLSGWCSLGAGLGDLGYAAVDFPTAIRSGAHSRSVDMVATGVADVAAIDGATFRLLERYRPSVLKNVRGISLGPVIPATPLITRSHTPIDIETVRGAVADAVIDDLASDARDVLGIESFVPLRHADYLPILELVSKAEAVIPRQRLSVP